MAAYQGVGESKTKGWAFKRPRRTLQKSLTVVSYNSCTECLGRPGIIHDRTPDCNSFSCIWMHRWPHNWFVSYVCHCGAWLIFRHVIHGYLYNQALADVRSTGVGIKGLYCSDLPCSSDNSRHSDLFKTALKLLY